MAFRCSTSKKEVSSAGNLLRLVYFNHFPSHGHKTRFCHLVLTASKTKYRFLTEMLHIRNLYYTQWTEHGLHLKPETSPFSNPSTSNLVALPVLFRPWQLFGNEMISYFETRTFSFSSSNFRRFFSQIRRGFSLQISTNFLFILCTVSYSPSLLPKHRVNDSNGLSKSFLGARPRLRFYELHIVGVFYRFVSPVRFLYPIFNS